MPENQLALYIYNILKERDRQIIPMVGMGLIPVAPILELCELYDATIEDFEKILLLDKSMQEMKNQKSQN